jgi:hypothetical protein
MICTFCNFVLKREESTYEQCECDIALVMTVISPRYFQGKLDSTQNQNYMCYLCN